MKAKLEIDPVLVIGTSVSILLAVLIYISQPNRVESTLTFGLIGIIFTLLLDLFGKIKQLEVRIINSVDVTSNIKSDSWFYETILNLIETWGKIKKLNHSPFIEIAQDKFTDLIGQLHDISSGEVIGDQSDYHLLLSLLESAKECLTAVSYVKMDWWKSEIGKKYLDENIKLSRKHNVKVTRIFILGSDERNDKSLMDEMYQNRMTIYYINAEDLPDDLHFDLAIADNKLMWTTEFTPERVFKEHRITIKPEDIQRGIQKFDKLMLISIPYKHK